MILARGQGGRGQWGLGGLFQSVSCRKWGRIGRKIRAWGLDSCDRCDMGKSWGTHGALRVWVAWLEVGMYEGVRNSVSDFSRIHSWLLVLPMCECMCVCYICVNAKLFQKHNSNLKSVLWLQRQHMWQHIKCSSCVYAFIYSFLSLLCDTRGLASHG